VLSVLLSNLEITRREIEELTQGNSHGGGYMDAQRLNGGITHIMGIFAEAFSLFAPTRKLQIENKEELATEICRRLAKA
jgi:hypothetical protein